MVLGNGSKFYKNGFRKFAPGVYLKRDTNGTGSTKLDS